MAAPHFFNALLAGALSEAAVLHRRPELADEAIAHLIEADKALPNDLEIYKMKYAALDAAGSRQAAEAHLKVMLDKWPNDAGVRQSYGALQLDAGNASEAEHAFRFVVEHEPHPVMSLLGLAESLMCQQRWNDAQEVAERVLSIPDEEMRGRAQERFGGFTYGGSRFFPAGADARGLAWKLIGDVAFLTNNLQYADTAYDRATIHGLPVPDVYANAAAVKLVVSGAEPALQVIKGGMDQNRGNPKLIYNRVLLELANGRVNDAERTLESLPNDADRRHAAALIRRAREGVLDVNEFVAALKADVAGELRRQASMPCSPRVGRTGDSPETSQ